MEVILFWETLSDVGMHFGHLQSAPRLPRDRKHFRRDVWSMEARRVFL